MPYITGILGFVSNDIPMESSAHDLHAATSQNYSSDPTREDGRLKAHRIEFEVTLRTILDQLDMPYPPLFSPRFIASNFLAVHTSPERLDELYHYAIDCLLRLQMWNKRAKFVAAKLIVQGEECDWALETGPDTLGITYHGTRKAHIP